MNKSHNPRGSFRKNLLHFFGRPVFLAAALLALFLTGCAMLRLPSSPPKAQVLSLQLTNQPGGQVTLEVLQAQVMRFADTYSATVAQACDDVAAGSTNVMLRESALRWKLGQSTSAYINATGQNPAVNALDMLVLVSIARMVVEDYGVETFGDDIRPLLLAQQKMETNAWMMASGMFKPSQKQELQNLIQEWRAKNPHQRYVGPIRFREFVTALGRTPPPSAAPTSIFSLLYLDPLAGLDPTAAAIQETRDMAERAMYYTQRMPTLLSWQVELLAYQLAGQPESQQVLNDANRLANAADLFAKTAQQVPQLIADSRTTLDATSAAATNINAAIQSLTAFVQYVSPTNGNASAGNTNGQPFNILDYGTAAAQIGAAACDLNAALQTLNQTAPQLARAGEESAAAAKKVVDHAFWCGLVLILILLGGAVLAGYVYRLLVNKTGAGSSPTKG